MGTISAKKLNEALSKAKNVGIVEESFTIDGCDLVLRNLRPDEYAAVLQECQGFEDIAYLNAYQKGHIAKAIVVVNGVDLHDTQLVEVEEEDPKHPGQIKNVKLELHAYLLKFVISTWSQEVVRSVYLKFGDVVALAERKAKDGITFIVPEETDEEKYCRLLLEAQSCQDDIPDTLVDKILDDLGLMRKSTAEEVKAAMEAADQLAREQAEKEQQIKQSQEQPSPEPIPEPQEVRQPLNKAPGTPPVDPHQTLQQVIAARQASSQAVHQEAQADAVAASRAAKIAALEAGVTPEEAVPVFAQPTEPVELKKQAPIDPNEVSKILDRPPAAGINPRFRPPQRA